MGARLTVSEGTVRATGLGVGRRSRGAGYGRGRVWSSPSLQRDARLYQWARGGWVAWFSSERLLGHEMDEVVLWAVVDVVGPVVFAVDIRCPRNVAVKPEPVSETSESR